MATRRAGTTCPVESISATSASITTTEGKVTVNASWPCKEVCVTHLLVCVPSHKDGYETFASWKKVWTSNGKSEPSLKAFMADQQLPFWVRSARFSWFLLTNVLHVISALRFTSVDLFLSGSVHQTRLQEVASADQGDPADGGPGCDVSLWDEVQQHQGKTGSGETPAH